MLITNFSLLIIFLINPVFLKDAIAKENGLQDEDEKINTDISAPAPAPAPIPSPGADECPTVVVTAVTGGDTPVSEDEMEFKEKEEPSKENGTSESTYQNADQFECTFPDVEESEVASQKVPSNAETVVEFGQASTEKEPSPAFSETEKMEVNGVDTAKNFFPDSQNAETTG